MVVEKLAKWHKRCMVDAFSETSARDVNKNPSKVIFPETSRLENFKFLPHFFELGPFILKWLPVKLSGCPYYFISEQIYFFFWPETGNVDLFGHVLDHVVENIWGILYAAQVETVS